MLLICCVTFFIPSILLSRNKYQLKIGSIIVTIQTCLLWKHLLQEMWRLRSFKEDRIGWVFLVIFYPCGPNLRFSFIAFKSSSFLNEWNIYNPKFIFILAWWNLHIFIIFIMQLPTFGWASFNKVSWMKICHDCKISFGNHYLLKLNY
jgi:hypothetical protein